MLGVSKRLPITLSILQKLREVWGMLAEQQDAMGGIMPLFLCLLCSGEVTTPSEGQLDLEGTSASGKLCP